ncbi:MAG: magnesium transporter CorA family protein [Gemmatimonadaceae bacterium]|nr:magnesium transporter CorA family protein [Gemmatimonadaceae bacterium]
MWSCYHDANGTVRKGLSAEELSGVLASGVGTLWVDLRRDDPADVDLLKKVFRFHPLAIEDSLNPESRVKLEEYKDFLILIVRGIEFCDETEDPYDIETANLTFFLGGNYLVTVHGEESPAVEEIREVLDRKPELVSYSPARLMHAIVDSSVNAYFPIIDRLDEFMDGLEEKIFAQFDQAALREIFSVKRLVLSLRRHLAPQRDVFAVLTNRPSPLLSPETQVYFRDIYDHVLRINDALETFRELLSSTLDSYLSQISNRLGTSSKTLSAVATLTVPFVVVSGMWGMNFQHIPLSSHPHGFWIMLVVQLLIGGFLVGVLKWLKVL